MLEVVDSTISDKAIELVAGPLGDGVVEREVEPERRGAPALAPEQLRAVAELAKRAERHYGCPQDVEWAIDAAGAVLLLQSRPETVWSRTPADPAPDKAPSYTAGLGSLVDTLVNPLAARRAADVHH
jgi:pyruvate,water dikinase